MTVLVIIDTRSAGMRRYAGRKLTHKVVPLDATAYPLSAAYVPVIDEFRLNPNRFFPSDPRHELPPKGVA